MWERRNCQSGGEPYAGRKGLDKGEARYLKMCAMRQEQAETMGLPVCVFWVKDRNGQCREGDLGGLEAVEG